MSKTTQANAKKSSPKAKTTVASKETKGATKGRKRVRFEVEAAPGSEVAVAGSFTDWKTDAIRLEDKAGDGRFAKFVYLPKGRYEYKFVINGQWSVDPNCSNWEPNEHGTLNSVLSVT